MSQRAGGNNQQEPSQDAQAELAQGAAGSEQGLDATVDMFKQLYKNYRRLHSGATLAIKQHLPGLDKLLRGYGPESSLEAVLQYINDTCR